MPEHKQYRIVVSRRAACQMQEHACFAAKLNERHAVKLMDDFQAAAASLTSMPRRAPLLQPDELFEQEYRTLLFGKWYLLIYKIRGDTVYIEYVADGRQDYRWMIE